MRSLVVACLTTFALLPLGAGAQDDRAQTLADIRQELTVLYVEVQRLKRELSTTGSPQVQTGGGSVLDRVAVIESELQRLTAKTEELEFRVDKIVRDGTNRIGDLEYRLVELEGGDVSTLGETSTLGGGAMPENAASAPAAATDAPELATQEAADFAQASAALESGDYETAAARFAEFNATYPGGPLAVEADLRRGDALDASGDTREAARAFLQAFSLDPSGTFAPEALFKLGRALGQLGSQSEACVTLQEVPLRFPDTAAANDASVEISRLGCG